MFTYSHLLIFTSSYLFTYSHLHIFTSSHLHIFTSPHLHIFTSSNHHICTSSHISLSLSRCSHLHIFTSSHLHIFTSSYLHILTSSHLLTFAYSHLYIFTYSLSLCLSLSLLFFFSLKPAGSADEARRYGHFSARTEVQVLKIEGFLRVRLVRRQPFLTKRGSSVKNWGFLASLVGPATLAHETRFECQKLKVFARFVGPAATVWRERRFERQKLRFFSDFGLSGSNLFTRNDVWVSKIKFFLGWVWLVRLQPLRTKWRLRSPEGFPLHYQDPRGVRQNNFFEQPKCLHGYAITGSWFWRGNML